MTVINIDLEDELPPVSFTLKPSDVPRFMEFMEENNKASKEIESLRAKLAEAEKKLKEHE